MDISIMAMHLPNHDGSTTKGNVDDIIQALMK